MQSPASKVLLVAARRSWWYLQHFLDIYAETNIREFCTLRLHTKLRITSQAVSCVSLTPPTQCNNIAYASLNSICYWNNLSSIRSYFRMSQQCSPKSGPGATYVSRWKKFTILRMYPKHIHSDSVPVDIWECSNFVERIKAGVILTSILAYILLAYICHFYRMPLS